MRSGRIEDVGRDMAGIHATKELAKVDALDGVNAMKRIMAETSQLLSEEGKALAVNDDIFLNSHVARFEGGDATTLI